MDDTDTNVLSTYATLFCIKPKGNHSILHVNISPGDAQPCYTGSHLFPQSSLWFVHKGVLSSKTSIYQFGESPEV